jgi:YhcH/YjgK/YiaL family protein
MILDDLSHAAHYTGLNPLFERAFAFLRRPDLGALASGRHDIDGDGVFALVADYDTKPRTACAWEAHRRHVDLQFVHSGHERFGIAALSGLAAEPYDAARDVLFAKGEGEFFTLRPNRFVILFPHDAHMPGVAADQPVAVRKIVVKVRLYPSTDAAR